MAEQNVTSCELCRFRFMCHRKDTPNARNGLCSIFKKRGAGVVRHDQFTEARVVALEKRMDAFESMSRGFGSEPVAKGFTFESMGGGDRSDVGG